MANSSVNIVTPETIRSGGIFPVPFLHLHWDDADLNDALYRETVSSARDSGISVSNRGGWHSDREILESATYSMRKLEAMIVSGLNQYAGALQPPVQGLHTSQWELEAWVNVNPAGSWNVAHTHTARNNAISGVYYVRIPGDVAERSSAGAIVFEDHGGNPMPADHRDANGKVYRELALHPCAGDMVIFPAWLYHRVEPHYSDDARISIAFNARHPAIAVPRYPDMVRPNWRWRNFAGVMKAIQWVERMVKMERTR